MPSTTTSSPKPLVYSLDALQPEALALARKHFDLIAKEDGDVQGWEDHAQGLLVRESRITGDQLRLAKALTYLAKHGVGVDKIDVSVAREVGIHVMNTPGVNVSDLCEDKYGHTHIDADHRTPVSLTFVFLSRPLQWQS